MTAISHCIVTKVVAGAAAEVCRLPVHSAAAVVSSLTKSCRCRVTKWIPSGRVQRK